jgi:preprotein translocase subunit SecE
MARTGKPQRRFAGVSRFFKEVRNEMKKVIWPNREELITNTSVVIIVSLVTAVFVGVVDFGFSLLVRWIVER